MDLLWAGPSNPDLNRAMADWAAAVIWPGERQEFGHCTCMAVGHMGEPIAVIVWHEWNPSAGVIEFSGASTSKRWLTKPVLKEMFDYPFRQLGCQMAVARVSENNTPLLRQLEAYGFDRFRIPRLRGPDEDEIICTLTRAQWSSNKFNRRRAHGQAKSTQAP